MRILEKIVPPESEGRLLRQFVRGDMCVSYHRYASLKQMGAVFVDGEPARANHVLRAGNTVRLVMSDPTVRPIDPEAGEVTIPYLDEDVYVIDKSAPLACQCSPKQSGGTLENRLARIFADRDDYVFRPVNRLDKGTSGLMAAAMNAHACQRLQGQLHTEAFLREYLAVVEGTLSGEGEIDLPIAKEAAATVRRVIDLESGQRALTHYRALMSGGGRTLVRLRLETGRTHQIRVHMAALGHPVCGDFLYGTELDELPGRFALHSARIRFCHPVTGAEVALESPLPPEMARLLGNT